MFYVYNCILVDYIKVMEDTELWKPFPADTRYEVSNTGQLRNIRTQRLRKCSIGAGGYKRVVISYPGSTQIKGYDLHLMVAMTWLGPRPPGFDTSHKDGNKLNNSIDNLLYETRSSNMIRVGRVYQGTRKLTAKDVIEIRKAKEPLKYLCEKYSISRSTLWKLRNKLIWKHI